MKSLVGYTGFVGSNLNLSTHFDKVYNTKNIEDSFGTSPELLVYAGVRAEKYLANQFPEKDFSSILKAEEIIQKINPKKLVLISTIDVYHNPFYVDENTLIDENVLQPYGFNRYQLEKWVKQNFSQHLIVRLPGLYGHNLKKNFIYDLIHMIPSMLTCSKFEELSREESCIKQYYQRLENGFYKCNILTKKESDLLKQIFKSLGFSALNFTDSRGKFQFYNLKYLWEHIEKALSLNIDLLNLATEPIQISELYHYITGKTFYNEILDKEFPNYNFKTIHTDLCVKENYIFDKEFILSDIKSFVEEQQ